MIFSTQIPIVSRWFEVALIENIIFVTALKNFLKSNSFFGGQPIGPTVLSGKQILILDLGALRGLLVSFSFLAFCELIATLEDISKVQFGS